MSESSTDTSVVKNLHDTYRFTRPPTFGIIGLVYFLVLKRPRVDISMSFPSAMSRLMIC